MKKKIWKLALAAALAMPAMVMPVDAEAIVKSPFTDVSKNSLYVEIVHEMRDQQILSGYENGEFRPAEVISRKHAAALVNRAVKLPATKPFVLFKDVSTENAFFNDVKKLQQAGIFEPDAKGNLYPNQPITRAEMAKVLTIAFDLKVKVELDFMDVPKDHPASNYIRALYSNGITTGDFGFYNPDKSVTRVHYSVILHRLIHMNDPVDPAERIRGQFARVSEQQLGEPDQVALAMLSMLSQKITHDPYDYLITDITNKGYTDASMYWAGHSFGQLAKENIRYLERFAVKGSEQEAILDRWLKGDFSKIKDEFFTLKAIGDPDFFNCAVCEQKFAINIRTKRAEEVFVRTLYGEEGVQRHQQQWGTKGK
ncbi:S-layer homology domain-containing protein [Sporosarcina sp. E16_8]|uniref:S-layer homology domain-containing protein n=1 Tax=Sporosarcina sp. E16_8 TaxID=2789295 RepID=UPI001A919107|nr:S-layer homology domain-containing protein [Sporosarcina sp. E16_8]MBO0587994.1 S-layer homology domain-containing protein [Sporosarcina sp. E16_8]